jgi:hypothetical protein
MEVSDALHGKWLRALTASSHRQASAALPSSPQSTAGHGELNGQPRAWGAAGAPSSGAGLGERFAVGAFRSRGAGKVAVTATPEQRTAEPAGQVELGQVELQARIEELEQTVRQLRCAMRSRTLIDQAMGVIMALEDCDQERAFRLLRALSQQQNRKVNQVAADIIRHVTGVEPSDDPKLHLPLSPHPVDNIPLTLKDGGRLVPISVFVLDDHEIVRRGVTALRGRAWQAAVLGRPPVDPLTVFVRETAQNSRPDLVVLLRDPWARSSSCSSAPTSGPAARACRSRRAGASRTRWPSATSTWPGGADARIRPRCSVLGRWALRRPEPCAVPEASLARERLP